MAIIRTNRYADDNSSIIRPPKNIPIKTNENVKADEDELLNKQGADVQPASPNEDKILYILN